MVEASVSIVFVSVYLVVLSMGFFIRNKGMTWLIAGYDASLVRDEEGLARWVGSGVMGIGAAGILAGALIYVLSDFAPFLVLASVAVTLGVTITLVIGARRFLK